MVIFDQDDYTDPQDSPRMKSGFSIMKARTPKAGRSQQRVARKGPSVGGVRQRRNKRWSW